MKLTNDNNKYNDDIRGFYFILSFEEFHSYGLIETLYEPVYSKVFYSSGECKWYNLKYPGGAI